MPETPSSWPSAPGQGTSPRWAPPPPADKPHRPLPKAVFHLLAGVVVVAIIAAGFGAIKLFEVFQGSGKTQITQLHNQMKAQELQAIYDEADPAYRRNVQRDVSDQIFQTVRDHLGDPVTYTVQSVNTSTISGVERENLVLNTVFSKGNGIEHLSFRKDNGIWRLILYRCNSGLLNDVHIDSTKNTDDNDQ